MTNMFLNTELYKAFFHIQNIALFVPEKKHLVLLKGGLLLNKIISTS